VKLQRSLVDHIAHQVTRGLVREGAIEADAPDAAAESIASALSEDLMVEDRLNDEVREIMRSYADEMTRRGVQYHDMFKMIKQELVRKRKLIL
jgi:hypothetical protein